MEVGSSYLLLQPMQWQLSGFNFVHKLLDQKFVNKLLT